MIVMCPSFGVLRKCKIGLYWLASNSQLKDSGKCIENWEKLNKIFKACKLIEDSCPVQEKICPVAVYEEWLGVSDYNEGVPHLLHIMTNVVGTRIAK